MIVPVGSLRHEVPAGAHGDRVRFDREGCAIGRGVFSTEVIRALRAPLRDALVADRLVEPVDGRPDRLLWVGETEFDPRDYQPKVEQGVNELLLKPGLAAAAIEALWGTPAAIWEGVRLFAARPGKSTPPHRDAVPLSSSTEPSGQVRLWVPLTELGEGDGPLALAVGSHQIPDRPADTPPLRHAVHPDLPTITRQIPLEEQLAPLWRTSPLGVGDAIVFRANVVHGSAPNQGPFLRLSIVLSAQDARVPIALRAGLSLDSARPLTDLEWVILALHAVQPTSAWHARCACYARGIVGQTWTEQLNDRVERTFTTLQARKLIEPYDGHSEKSWWERYYQATPRGRSNVTEWLAAPEERDPRLRSLKLLLGDWLGLDPTNP